MNSEVANPTSEQPLRGYQRAAVDEFLAAAEAERSRLESLIADANDRASRARAAVGMHHIMVTMLAETQQELAQRRSDADRRSAEIIAAAEAQARAIERPPAAPVPPVTSTPLESPAAAASLSAIPAAYTPPAAGELASMAPRLQIDRHEEDEEADRFFAFLRRALVDDEPLGPRPEPQT